MSSRKEEHSPEGFQRETRASRLRQRNVPEAGQRAASNIQRRGGSSGRGQASAPVPAPTPSLTAAPAAGPSPLATSRPAITSVGSGTPAPPPPSTKSKKDTSLQETYLNAFKDPTRENIKRIIDTDFLNYMSFQFKEYGQVTPGN